MKLTQANARMLYPDPKFDDVPMPIDYSLGTGKLGGASLGVDETVGQSSNASTYSAKAGQGPLAIGGNLDPSNPYAAMAYMAGTGQMDFNSRANRWITHAGQEYNSNLSGLSSEQIAQLDKLGRQMTSAEASVDAQRAAAAQAQRLAQSAQVATQKASVGGDSSNTGGHFETVPSMDIAGGGMTGGTEQVWVSDGPAMSYGQQMRNVGKFFTDAPIGVTQQIIENPIESLRYAGQGIVGLAKGAPNFVTETLTQVGVGTRYLAVGGAELVGLASPGALSREVAQYGDFSGRLFEYDNTSQAAAGFVSGFATPSLTTKAVASASDLYSLTRTATTASRDWSYGVMEREALGARTPFAEMSIPSFNELNYMAKNTLDFSTKVNGALFWSDQNMKTAQLFGNLTGKTTLEQTGGGRYLDSLNLFPLDVEYKGARAGAVFDIASERFAAGASGNLNTFTFGAQRFSVRGERTWWRVEQPILRNANPEYPNPNVTNIREWRFPWEPTQ